MKRDKSTLPLRTASTREPMPDPVAIARDLDGGHLGRLTLTRRPRFELKARVH